MNMSPLLLPHICAGIIGFLSGVAALFLRKGSRPHRIAGNVFFPSMLTMSAAGAYMAAFVTPVHINVIAGVLTFCLVGTGWLTVIRKAGETGRTEYGLLLVTALVAAACVVFARQAANSATGLDGGAPVAAYLIFGSVALLCVGTDISVLIRGGVFGRQRTARHLWRMCLALLLTTFSLFVGTPNKLLVPAAIRQTELRFVPVIIVLATFIFWLWRVLLSPTLLTIRKAQVAGPPAE